MSTIGIISAICAIALVLLGFGLYYFDRMKMDTEKCEETTDQHTVQYLGLGILTALCILIAWMAFMHDAATKASHAEMRKIRFQQDQIERDIRRLESQTTDLMNGSTWMMSTDGLREFNATGGQND